MGRRSILVALIVAVTGLVAGALWSAPARATSPFTTPIQHVVVIFEENHSFDNMLGKLCVMDHRCNGVTTGVLPDGTRIPLKMGTDLVPEVGHAGGAQTTAINGGAMNGFAHLPGCAAHDQWVCYTTYDPSQIPNTAALARAFVISDDTFETSRIGSWGSHLSLVASNPDGFLSEPEAGQGPKHGKGGGCDSYKDALWQPPVGNPFLVPTCVPDADGNGPYRTSPVPYEPTIMDRMDAAGLTWKLYAAEGPNKQGGSTGYVWAVCPTFAECIYGPQKQSFVASTAVIQDAKQGLLPNLTMVVPNPANSEHNKQSMTQGDDWIGSVVGAIENGPQWNSTAIFITWDDCGCFYDHVAPPSYAGVREPMIIVSPYAKAGYTDSGLTTFNGILAYTEHAFGLDPLSDADGFAYDYANSFDYSQSPLPGVPMVHRKVPAWELRWMKAHPELLDPNDIT